MPIKISIVKVFKPLPNDPMQFLNLSDKVNSIAFKKF